ncbi:hypothetical protein ACFWP2_31430 [Kitasatospora sp. NPDC058444]|uniref:hypothetical protein n=1 Tax=Kitasatospora sp. NPDC058444 TaxID=3346504 RepID=UPI00365FE2F7
MSLLDAIRADTDAATGTDAAIGTAEALARLRELAPGLGVSYVLPNAQEGNAYRPLLRP